MNAQSIDGAWQGTITGGGAEIRVILHVTTAADGGFTATLDSPDQAVTGLAVAPLKLVDSTVTFDVPRIGGRYEGKVDAARIAMIGTWSQLGMSTPLKLSRLPPPSTIARVSKPSEIDGGWEGTLDAGGATLRLVLHVLTFEDGNDRHDG